MKPTGKKATVEKRIVLGRNGRMELKRRFKDHPLRHMLPTSKPLSYWTTSECIQFARQLQIDYTDLVKSTSPTPSVSAPEAVKSSPLSSPPRPNSPSSSAALPSLNPVPLSYRIQIFSNPGCVYLLELVNSTRVWELKQFLRKLYSQGLPESQVLTYQKRVLADDQPLIAYFGTARYVQVEISHWIHVCVKYKSFGQWNETRTTVVDHSDASVLLQGVCNQLGWNADSYQLRFQETLLDREGGATLSALGVVEDSVLLLESIAPPPSPILFDWEDSLDFLSSDPLLGLLHHPEMICPEFSAFLQEDLDVSG